MTYLTGFRPIPHWATETITEFEAHAAATEQPTKPQREFVDRLLELTELSREATQIWPDAYAPRQPTERR